VTGVQTCAHPISKTPQSITLPEPLGTADQLKRLSQSLSLSLSARQTSSNASVKHAPRASLLAARLLKRPMLRNLEKMLGCFPDDVFSQLSRARFFLLPVSLGVLSLC